MHSILGDLLVKLSEETGVNLAVDAHGVCKMRTIHDIELQLEYSYSRECLLCIAMVGKVDSGPFRTRLFLDLLKNNDLDSSQTGIFGFCEKQNLVTLHILIPESSINATNLLSLMQNITTKALTWKSVVEKGYPAPLFNQNPPKPYPGMMR